jgi:hypothetical protein
MNYPIRAENLIKKFGKVAAIDGLNLRCPTAPYMHSSARMEQERQQL